MCRACADTGGSIMTEAQNSSCLGGMQMRKRLEYCTRYNYHNSETMFSSTGPATQRETQATRVASSASFRFNPTRRGMGGGGHKGAQTAALPTVTLLKRSGSQMVLKRRDDETEARSDFPKIIQLE
ncbi:uncharacterized protein RBU33_010819 isoform 1-T1 [Hipposideros larvatus]